MGGNFEVGMTTILDKRLIPRVKVIVDKYGKTVTFRTYPAETYDAASGSTTEGVKTDYSRKVTPPQNYESKYIDGEIIQEGDCQIFVPTKDLGFTPAKGMKVIFDSEVWKIIGLKPIYTGDDIALYELQLRR